MTKVLLIVALVLIGLALAARWAGRKTLQRASGRMDELLAGRQPVLRDGAVLRRLTSRGPKANGIGILALTGTELLFVAAVGGLELRVQRHKITGVGAEDKRLVVGWDGEQAAWDVRKRGDWERALSES